MEQGGSFLSSGCQGSTDWHRMITTSRAVRWVLSTLFSLSYNPKKGPALVRDAQVNSEALGLCTRIV